MAVEWRAVETDVCAGTRQWGGHLDFLSRVSWEKAGGGAVNAADQRKCPGAL